MNVHQPEPAQRTRRSPDSTRLAIFATCGIFAVAFGTMIAIVFAKPRIPGSDAILDTCEWLVALTATAIVGLITRSRS
jgi:hypothetical protein